MKLVNLLTHPAGACPQVPVRRLELWEDNLHQELLHLLLVYGLLEENVRHRPNHMKSPVLLTGSRPIGLDDLQQQVHRLLQHLLPAEDQ